MSTAIVNGDNLYGFSHLGAGRLFCLDIETGNINWQGPPRTAENVMFLAVPNHVLALLNHGELRVLNADPSEYKVAQTWKVANGQSWAAPVLLQDGLLVRDDSHLTRWEFE